MYVVMQDNDEPMGLKETQKPSGKSGELLTT
jgi:hypothetical protein